MSNLDKDTIMRIAKYAPRPDEIKTYEMTLPWGNPVTAIVTIYHQPPPNREIHLNISCDNHGPIGEAHLFIPKESVALRSSYFLKANDRLTDIELIEYQGSYDVNPQLNPEQYSGDNGLKRILHTATAENPRDYESTIFIKDISPRPRVKAIREQELENQCSRLKAFIEKLDRDIVQQRSK
jgi:hypothetical protein